MNNLKAGYLTTEFWITVVSLLLDGVTALVNGNVYVNHPHIAIALLAAQGVLVGLYTIGRSVIKASAAYSDPTPETPVTASTGG